MDCPNWPPQVSNPKLGHPKWVIWVHTEWITPRWVTKSVVNPSEITPSEATPSRPFQDGYQSWLHQMVTPSKIPQLWCSLNISVKSTVPQLGMNIWWGAVWVGLLAKPTPLFKFSVLPFSGKIRKLLNINFTVIFVAKVRKTPMGWLYYHPPKGSKAGGPTYVVFA